VSWDLNEAEFASVTALSPRDRYEHFVSRVVDWEKVWSLGTDEGWALAADDDGNEVVPVWPHERYAAACAKDGWAGNKPKAIPLADWLERWLPGIERDGRFISVFPLADGAGAQIAPGQLAEDLAEAARQY
jgi:Protein of unknown function (DUF2750)